MTRLVHMRGDVAGMFLLFLVGFLGLWQLLVAWKRLHGLSLTGCPDRRWASALLGAALVVGACGWYFSRPGHFASPDVEGAETVFLFVLGLAAASLLQVALATLADLYLWRGPRTASSFPSPGIAGEEVVLQVGSASAAATWRPAEREGSGPAVLLLHGYGGCRRDLAALGAFLAASGHAVLAPDLDGHGGNPSAISSPRMEGLVEAALAWLEERGGGTGIAVVGVGFGGTLALSLLAEDKRVAKAIALDPPAQEKDGAPCINVLRECRARDALGAFLRPPARGDAGRRVSQARLLESLPPPAALDAGRAVVIGTAGSWVNSPEALRRFTDGMGLAPPTIVPGSHATVRLREESFEAVKRSLEP